MWEQDSYNDAGGFRGPGNETISTPKGGAQGGRPRNAQNLVAVRICDIHRMSDDEEHLKLMNEHECGNITVVGVVRSVDISSTKASIRIDDRTGPWIEAQLWGDSTEVQDVANIGVGMYVRVVGVVRSMTGNQQKSSDKRIIIIFKLRPVTDLNELTCHLLECLQTRIAVSVKEKKTAANTVAGAGGASTSRANITEGFAPMGDSDNGFTRPQQLVFNLIRGCSATDGMHMRTIVERLTAHGITNPQVREATEFLMNEGHIYSTVNEEMFKTIEA